MHLLTERLLLRDFEPTDWPAVLAYQKDPLYLRYYEWTERTPEAVQEFVGRFIARQQEKPRTKFQFAIILRSSGELIGNCGIRKESAEAHEADMGFELSPRHWGQGYATEAARAVLEFGFTSLGLHRVWAECVADNVGSARVLTKLGMQLEGRLREKEYFKGRRWDRLLFAVLQPEWGASNAERDTRELERSVSATHGQEVRHMPFIHVTMGQLSDMAKPQLVSDLTAVFAAVDIPADWVSILFQHVGPADFARGGQSLDWTAAGGDATDRAVVPGPGIVNITMGEMGERQTRQIAGSVARALMDAGVPEAGIKIFFRHVSGREVAEGPGTFPFRPPGSAW